MTQELWAAVDTYLTDLFDPGDAALEAALADSDAAGLPAIAISSSYGKLLMILAQATGARQILEIGTLGGYSAIWLARALPPGGQLLTLEANPKHAAVARANIARAGLGEAVEVRVGRAVETLPQLEAEGRGPFDLIFIDADKPSYTEYLHWSLHLARPGTLIIADNVVRQGQVIDVDSDDANVQGVRRFNEALAAEPRISATILQTVSGKGYDGLAVAVVTGNE
ncbi:O-methyltransferase [Promineifilum sp.]|uniref:O-methyltransferase n=1 Tax=Promineifilum sp. TaxID=2664178 RepID=UPI0035AFA94C